jgi:CSLREA domain-containing protein
MDFRRIRSSSARHPAGPPFLPVSSIRPDRFLPGLRRALCVLLFLVPTLYLAGCSGATNLVVNSTGDETDTNPGDGTCRTAVSSTDCTLRAAIKEANVMSGLQSITFDLPTGSVIHPETALPEITDDLIIDGALTAEISESDDIIQINGEQLGTSGGSPKAAGFVVSSGKIVYIANAWIRRFTLNVILNYGNPSLDGLKITENDKAVINSFSPSGGDQLSVIHSDVTDNGRTGIQGIGVVLDIDDVTVRGNGESGIRLVCGGSLNINNSAVEENSSPTEAGGVVFLDGSLAITDSTISANAAEDVDCLAGGVAVLAGTADINNSAVSDNNGWFSGSLYVDSAVVHLSAGILYGNNGYAAGGALVTAAPGTALWVEDGTRIEMNRAAGFSEDTKYGGGIYVENEVHIADSFIETNDGAGIQTFTEPQQGTFDLDVARSSISHNTLTGVILRGADMSIEESLVSDNSQGGILVDRGSLNMTGSTVERNNYLGGITVLRLAGEVSIINSTIATNSAQNRAGGGILYNGNGQLTILRSTISGNTADEGGGLYINAEYTSGEPVIRNITVSNNHGGINGGGFFADHGDIHFVNVTIAGNDASMGAGVSNMAATLHFRNSILAGNVGDNCLPASAIISGGHNLDDGDTCGFSKTSDLVNTPAQIGVLADNGGPTKTIALLTGSPAIDSIDPAAFCPAKDQRGVSRPQGAACDRGAYESDRLTPAQTPIVDLTPLDLPTPTPSPTRSLIVFDPVKFSSPVVYGAVRACDPKQVTVQGKISSPDLVGSLGLFHRLESKEDASTGPWSEGLAMTPTGNGWYELTLWGENIPGASEWEGEAWVAVPFVANDENGEILSRSEIFRLLTFGQCGTG